MTTRSAARALALVTKSVSLSDRDALKHALSESKEVSVRSQKGTTAHRLVVDGETTISEFRDDFVEIALSGKKTIQFEKFTLIGNTFVASVYPRSNKSDRYKDVSIGEYRVVF